MGELTAYSHCLLLHEYCREISPKAVTEAHWWGCPEVGLVCFLLKKNASNGGRQHQDGVTHPHTLRGSTVEAEARVCLEDVIVALVRLTLETLFLALSEIASLCFSSFSLLCMCFFSSPHLPASHLLFSFSFSPALRCFEAAPTGGRQTPVPVLPRVGRERTPQPGGQKAASRCHLLTRIFYVWCQGCLVPHFAKSWS